MPDIDIDFPDRTEILKIIDHIPAAIIDSERTRKHNTGIYVQAIPFNPLTGTASLDYKTADSRGYFKIDLLNVNIYKDIEDEAHLTELLNQEPDWELLQVPEFVDQLFHINGHSDILGIMKPQTPEQLAAVLAMIRPGKRYLVGKPWDQVFDEVWIKDSDAGYSFKRAHALSYAMAIVVQINLLTQQALGTRTS